MKVWEIQDEFGIDNMKLTERPEPEPGQVLVEVRARSLNARDLQMVKGLYDPNLVRPRVPLSDGAGQVVAVGEGVNRFVVGDRVAGTFMQGWTDGVFTSDKVATGLGGPIDGVAAEKVVFAQEGLVRVPDHLSFEEAATLPCAAVTAWNALVEKGGLKAGDTVLVQGTGGVSIFALQIAKMFGARTIVTSSSNEKLSRALKLGASDGINYRQDENWDKKVLELTDDQGVDHVIEVGGPGTLGRSLNAVKAGGNVALIGVLTGVAGNIPTVSILAKAINVRGISVGSRRMFEDLNRALPLNPSVGPIVDREFRFEDVPDALRHLDSGAHFGKIVVTG